MANWTKQELGYLTDCYGSLSAAQIAANLGRSEKAVWWKAFDLKLTSSTRQKPTICWNCAKAVGGCSWSQKRPQPVPGWTAERTTLPGYTKNAPLTESYLVLKCPQFQPDERRREYE